MCFSPCLLNFYFYNHFPIPTVEISFDSVLLGVKKGGWFCKDAMLSFCRGILTVIWQGCSGYENKNTDFKLNRANFRAGSQEMYVFSMDSGQGQLHKCDDLGHDLGISFVTHSNYFWISPFFLVPGIFPNVTKASNSYSLRHALPVTEACMRHEN